MAYRLRVCDLRSDQVMDILPIQGVTFDDYIGKTGSLSGTIPVPDAGMARRCQDAIQPGRTMAWLERGQDVVWGGPIWVATPTRDERGYYTLPVQGAGVESYYRAHRQQVDTLIFTATDQLDIARSLISYATSRAGGDIGVEIDYTLESGVPRDRTYQGADLQWVGTHLDQLAATQGGFEWRINCYRTSDGMRHKALQLGYPKIRIGSTDTVLTSPGPITAYSLPQDATVQANSFIARGSTVNINLTAASFPLMSGPWTTPADYAAGWPLLEGSADYSSVADQTILDQYGQAGLARWVRPITIPSVRVLTAAGPLPEIGSTIRLRIQDVWYPAGYDARWRLVGYKVSPEERGRPETTDLYLGAL